jgi:hypothetical protein
MLGYVVSRPVVLRTATQVKHIAATDDFERIGVDRVQIDALNELKYVRAKLARDFPESPVEKLVKAVPYAKLTQWPQFPMMLGRRGHAVAGEGDVLRQQLFTLRERYPQTRRFRILINNGFGTNLGDTLVGLTAFRAAWSLLKEQLPEPSIDVLTGWIPMDGVTHLLRQQEGIEQILNQGPSLQAMARYHGFFDFANLIALPRYGEIPPVDWYLWWLGLDPAQVKEADKRNRIALDSADSEAIAACLSAYSGPKILINAKASASLRRMPESVLQSLSLATLASDPALWVVFDQPVHFEHPRVIHLSAIVNSPQRLAALIAQVDGVITPDTFLQHVADAVGTPTCTLNTSVPADFFRYYPTVQTLVLPVAESLRGWGKTKVSAEEWEELAPAYAQVWSQLDSSWVMAALDRARQNRNALLDGEVSRIDKPRSPFRPALTVPDVGDSSRLVPSGERASDESEALARQIRRLCRQVLLPGDTVALLGAGAGALAASLAECIAPYGRLIAFEHRRGVHQLLCANMIRSGHEHIETHPVMPTGKDFAVVPMPSLSLRDDHVPTAESNQSVTEPVVCWPLDRLELPHCRLLVVQAPVPMVPALEGAAETLLRHRPFVVAGPVCREDFPELVRVLRDASYDVKAVPLHEFDLGMASLPDEKALIFVAQPRLTPTSRETA